MSLIEFRKRRAKCRNGPLIAAVFTVKSGQWCTTKPFSSYMPRRLIRRPYALHPKFKLKHCQSSVLTDRMATPGSSSTTSTMRRRPGAGKKKETEGRQPAGAERDRSTFR